MVGRARRPAPVGQPRQDAPAIKLIWPVYVAAGRGVNPCNCKMTVSVRLPAWFAVVIGTLTFVAQMPPEVTDAVSSGATADPLQGLKVPPFKFAKTKDAGMLCPAPSVNAAVGVLNQSATSTLVRVLVNDQLV